MPIADAPCYGGRLPSRIRTIRTSPLPRRLRTTLALAGALSALILVVAPSIRADDPAAAEAKYRTWLKRPSLYKRTQGRVAFARTQTVRALECLVEDYLRPEEPKDHVRYLIATLAAENLTTAREMAPVFAAWRGKARTPADAWLWFKALGAEGLLDSPSTIEVARADKEPAILRAAALRNLANASGEAPMGAVEHVLTNLPPADPDRALLLETCAAVIRTWGWGLKDDAKVRGLVEKLARTLDVDTLSIDTRDIVARHLAGLFHTDVLGPGSAPWLRELAAAEARPAGEEPPEVKYAPGPFFGLRAIGRRIVYVIDVSDSMLAPLTPDELRTMKPVTREDEPPKGKLPPKKDPDEPLPWQKIKNRLDAAREVLKRSLRAMKPDQSFCVILFGNDAKALAATPGLRTVEPKTIAAAIAELDALVPTPAPGDKTRPHGKLRGETNLHGGLRLAFRATTKGLLGPGEYVDLSKTGCDGVFVLSDGVPSTDDFRKVDRRDDEKTVKDRESMEPIADTANITFQGPYGAAEFESFGYLTDDVRRMNLFRQAEIHCVAIGEASDAVLQAIADIGGGQFRRVGSAANTEGK